MLDAAALPRSGRRLLGEGFVVGVANPKAIIFLAAILPQFVARDGAPAGLQMLVLGLIFLLLALVCDSVVGRRRRLGPQRAGRVAARGWSAWAAPAAWSMIGLGARLAFVGRAD